MKSVYRHYDLLIDVLFWFNVLTLTRAALYGLGVNPTWLLANHRWFTLAIGIPGIIAQLGLFILIVARRFRDENAERIWQKAAATFVTLIPIFLIAWIVGFYVYADLGGRMDWLRGHPDVSIIPQHALFPNPSRSIGVYQFEGVNFLVLKFISYFPVVFIGLYKWHRWRDERA